MSAFWGGFLIAILTGSAFISALLVIASIKLSSRISREEEERNPAYSEHDIHCACEGALIDALITNSPEKANV